MNGEFNLGFDALTVDRVVRRAKALALFGAGAYIIAKFVIAQSDDLAFFPSLIMGAVVGGILGIDREDSLFDESMLMGILYGIIGAALFYYYHESYPLFSVITFGGMLGLALHRGTNGSKNIPICIMASATACIFAFLASSSIAYSPFLEENLPPVVIQAAAGSAFAFSMSLAELFVTATEKKVIKPVENVEESRQVGE